MDDLVIWVDENDTELGTVPRKRAHEEGLLHRIAVVIVTDQNGNILIQERMSSKLDHSSAGHVEVGETYVQAAKRELYEELGMDSVELKYVGKGMTDEGALGGASVKHMYEVYTCSGEPKTLAEGEVKSVFWMKPEQVRREMEDPETAGKYTLTFPQTLRLFLDAGK
jgi:isopentenyl-diphosphate Delta-isomerase